VRDSAVPPFPSPRGLHRSVPAGAAIASRISTRSALSVTYALVSRPVDERSRRGSLIAEVVNVAITSWRSRPLVLSGLLEVRIVENGAATAPARHQESRAPALSASASREPQPAPQAQCGGRSPHTPASRERRTVYRVATSSSKPRRWPARPACSSRRGTDRGRDRSADVSSSFFRTSGGRVATSAPIIARQSRGEGGASMRPESPSRLL